jgi:hypothetical protein
MQMKGSEQVDGNSMTRLGSGQAMVNLVAPHFGLTPILKTRSRTTYPPVPLLTPSYFAKKGHRVFLRSFLSETIAGNGPGFVLTLSNA